MNDEPPLEHDAFIGLGGNLDDPVTRIRAGTAALAQLAGSRVVARSSLYRSTPMGLRDQPDFINAVVRVATTLTPHALLEALLALERVHGRVRTQPNGPRTLDLDLLLFDQMTIEEAALTVPHPRMHERAFVLAPLVEIAPQAVIPGRGLAEALLAAVRSAGVWRLPV